MTSDEMGKIDAIGNGRVETITAGSCVIKALMEKFRFGKIVVSAQGLREGTLSIFLENSKGFYSGDITQETIQNFVKFSCEPEVLPEHTETLVKSLISKELINERERVILTHAIRKVSQVQPVANLHNLFYMLIDEDNAYLSHREQIVMALSIIRTKKIKTADWLFARYGTILKPQNRKSIQKIATCIVLSDIFEKVRAKVKFETSGKKFEMKIMSKSTFPKRLLENAIKDFETAFDISVVSSVTNDPRKSNSELVKINERK
jgi:exopolyphosphatase/guanosine-5'-triphosphate,3'-diphosphate pyrophosphatase